MKLLYVYDKMPKTYQTYLKHLLEALKNKIGAKVLVYDNDNTADYKIYPKGLKIMFFRLFSMLKVFQLQPLDLRIMSKFDIIHLQHSFLYPKCNYYYSPGIKRPKIVVTLRGGDTYIKPWVFPWWKEFFEVKSEFIDAFITVSEHQKEYLQKWGVSKDKIHVVPVSFGSKSLTEPKYPSKKIIKIVSAFRMCWEKNIDGNLKVIKFLKEQGYNVEYDIFGDGSDRGQLFYLIDKYNLEEVVNVHGKIENNIFKNKLSGFDFYLQLSLSEALGASVIEAQSMGIPAIISNVGGLPETILQEKSGFCIDSNDSHQAANHIIDLFKNREQYYHFSTRAIQYSNQNFTITNEFEKLNDLYKSLLND